MYMEEMPAYQLLRSCHFFTAYDTCGITCSKFFRSCIREPVVHIGSDFTITKVIRNTNLEVPEGLIKLSQQMQRHTIVHEDDKEEANVH